MVFVIIPYSSFIESWSDDVGGSSNWLVENIGKIGVDWIAADNVGRLNNKLNDIDEVMIPAEGILEFMESVESAIFWFKREEDAVAFKLRWL